MKTHLFPYYQSHIPFLFYRILREGGIWFCLLKTIIYLWTSHKPYLFGVLHHQYANNYYANICHFCYLSCKKRLKASKSCCCNYKLCNISISPSIYAPLSLENNKKLMENSKNGGLLGVLY